MPLAWESWRYFLNQAFVNAHPEMIISNVEQYVIYYISKVLITDFEKEQSEVKTTICDT